MISEAQEALRHSSRRAAAHRRLIGISTKKKNAPTFFSGARSHSSQTTPSANITKTMLTRQRCETG